MLLFPSMQIVVLHPVEKHFPCLAPVPISLHGNKGHDLGTLYVHRNIWNGCLLRSLLLGTLGRSRSAASDCDKAQCPDGIKDKRVYHEDAKTCGTLFPYFLESCLFQKSKNALNSNFNFHSVGSFLVARKATVPEV